MKTTSEPKLSRYLFGDCGIFTDKVIIVDVGARYGCDPFWEYAFGDNVIQHGFEPDPEEYKKLSEGTAKRNTKNSLYYPVALHANKGAKEFFFSRYPAGSGFYKPDVRFWNRFPAEVAISTMHTEFIDTIDLDTFGNQHGIERIDFLKIDVEGGELDVLNGCIEYLQNSVLGILTEVRFHNSSNSPTFADTDQFLREMGFKLYNLQLNRNTRKSLSHSSITSHGTTVPWGFSKGIGQVVSGDALYFRDTVAELTSAQEFNTEWNEETILKLASFYELFSLPDCAIELLQHPFPKDYLKDHPIRKYCNLLTPNYDGEEVTYEQYLESINIDYAAKVANRYDIQWKKILLLLFRKIVVQHLSPAMYVRLRKLKGIFSR